MVMVMGEGDGEGNGDGDGDGDGDPEAVNRSNFLALTRDFDIYNSIRHLIVGETYWNIEERHYKEMLQVIRDYNVVKR